MGSCTHSKLKLVKMYGIVAAYLALVAGHTAAMSADFLDDGHTSMLWVSSSGAIVLLAWALTKVVDRIDRS